VFELQERLRAERADGGGRDVVLLLEHTPVVTLGRGADDAHVLLGAEALRARGIDREKTNRGGDVTLHAPGQLVGYPIVDLRPDRCDVRKYVKDLAETMRQLAERHGVAGGEVPGKVGFWVDRENPGTWNGEEHAAELAKLGAIGVRISHWTTMHGFALNLTTEPDLFDVIVPCGIREYGVTSIRSLVGRSPELRTEAEAAHRILASVLDADPASFVDASSEELAALTPPSAPGFASVAL
jgi:lipoyl(octanoyl) transferase